MFQKTQFTCLDAYDQMGYDKAPFPYITIFLFSSKNLLQKVQFSYKYSQRVVLRTASYRDSKERFLVGNMPINKKPKIN